MPRTRKDEATLVLDEAEITSRHAELDGYTVVFEAYHADVDPAELFRGLPDDRCQCTHWPSSSSPSSRPATHRTGCSHRTCFVTSRCRPGGCSRPASRTSSRCARVATPGRGAFHAGGSTRHRPVSRWSWRRTGTGTGT